MAAKCGRRRLYYPLRSSCKWGKKCAIFKQGSLCEAPLSISIKTIKEAPLTLSGSSSNINQVVCVYYYTARTVKSRLSTRPRIRLETKADETFVKPLVDVDIVCVVTCYNLPPLPSYLFVLFNCFHNFLDFRLHFSGNNKRS